MASRLQESIDAVGESYPQFKYSALESGSKTIGVWQPIRTADNLVHLLDDVHHDRPVRVVGDEVQHLESCTAVHCDHAWQNRATDLGRSFEIEIQYDGGQAVPRCRVLSPRIPPEKRHHMWIDGVICAFLASENVWIWHSDTVADYVPHALIWLVKWMVFDQTSVWIGAQHENTPQHHLAIVRPKQP